jgi:hypothetical protein
VVDCLSSNPSTIKKNQKTNFRVGGWSVQAVECLLSKHKALSPNPINEEKKRGWEGGKVLLKQYSTYLASGKP